MKDLLIELLVKYDRECAYIHEDGPGFVVIDGVFDLDSIAKELEERQWKRLGLK